jgi:hypothetical protein
MRTTITLADDVAAAVEKVQREQGRGVSDVVNELIRRGLTGLNRRQPFQQLTASMGEPLLPLDDVAVLLEVLDGPSSR